MYEINPTEYDMNLFNELADTYKRNPEEKVLGFRDIVKAIKFCKKVFNWDISSFVIRVVVRNLTVCGRLGCTDNALMLHVVLQELQQICNSGFFQDPYQDSPILIKYQDLHVDIAMRFMNIVFVD